MVQNRFIVNTNVNVYVLKCVYYSKRLCPLWCCIWDALNDEYLRPPTSTAEWQNIANEYPELWNFPCCVGAIDDKHIAIQCPENSGSLFYNYKGFSSIVLIAVCDAHYVFSLVNIGDFRSSNDSGVLQTLLWGEHLKATLLEFQIQNPLREFIILSLRFQCEMTFFV